MQPTSKPTLAQVRALAYQLPPASRHKLLAELLAAELADETQEIRAISQAVRAAGRARGLSPITDEDIDRELKAHRQQRAA